MIHAYFIGGPADLTKRAMDDDPPCIEFAELGQTDMVLHPSQYPVAMRARVHLYRRITSLRRGYGESCSGVDAVVYPYVRPENS